MRILFVAPEIRIRGASLSLLGLIEQLQKKGHEVAVVVRKKNNEYVDALQKVGADIIYCKYYLWVIHGVDKPIKKGLVRGIHRMACYLNRFQAKKLAGKMSGYDIIHTNTTATDFGAYLSKYMKIPHIWHVREFGKEDFGFMTVFSEKYFYQFMEENSEKIILISNAIAEKYEKYINPVKLDVIYNGISQERFWNSEKSILKDSKKVQIVVVGYLTEAKGQHILIQALPEIIANIGTQIKVCLVGSSDVSYKDRLLELVQTLQVKDYVEFIDFTTEVEKILLKSDISVICSKAEGFGRVTAEAMLAGNLVVGANSGGTAEVLGYGRYGRLYERDNHVELAKVLIQAITKKEESAMIAKAGQEHARTEFTVEHNADQIIKVYQNVLDMTTKKDI